MSVGQKLRQERTRLGINLDTLARDTRISRRYLEAIEADDPESCPGSFFYRSFVRQYATHVGLDPADIEAEIDQVRPVVLSVPQASRYEPYPLRTPDEFVSASNRIYVGGRARVWGSVIALVAVVLGCSVMYAWWRQRETAAVAQAKIPSTEAVNQPAKNPPPAPVAQQPEAVAETPSQRPPDQTSSPSSPAEHAAASAAPPVASPAVPPDDKLVVAVSSREPAWISLVSDGKQIYSGTLEPGESKTVGGKEQARMRVGNAGGIEVTYNGKPIGPVGPRGQVRVVVFTPGGYQILPAAGITTSPTPVDTGDRRPPTL